MLLRVYLSGIFLLLFGGLCAQTITEDQFPDFDGPPLAAFEDSTHYYVSGDFTKSYPEFDYELLSVIDSSGNLLPEYVNMELTVDHFEAINLLQRVSGQRIAVGGDFYDPEESPNTGLFSRNIAVLNSSGIKVNSDIDPVTIDENILTADFQDTNNLLVIRSDSALIELMPYHYGATIMESYPNHPLYTGLPVDSNLVVISDTSVYYAIKDSVNSDFRIVRMYGDILHGNPQSDTGTVTFSGEITGLTVNDSGFPVLTGNITAANGSSITSKIIEYDFFSGNYTEPFSQYDSALSNITVSNDTLYGIRDLGSDPKLVMLDLAAEQKVDELTGDTTAFDYKLRDGRIYICGKHYEQNGEKRYFTRCSPGTLMPDSASATEFEYYRFDVLNEKVFFENPFDEQLSDPVNSNFVRVDKQDYTIEHLVDVNGTVLDFEHLNKDTLIVAGNFTDINQVPLKNLALFRTESGLLTTLPFGVNGEVRRVKQINDDYYFFGEFDTVNQSRVSKGAFRYNFKSGELDTLDFAVNGKVRDVVLYDSVIIVGGDFRKIDGSQCEPLVLLNREDLSYSESPVKIGFSGEGSVNKLSRYGSMLSVNGSFDWADNVERPNLFLYDLYNEEIITGDLRYTYYSADNTWRSNTIATGFLYGARLAIGAHGVANLKVSNLFHNTNDIHYFCDGGSVERIFMMDSLVLRFGQSRDVIQNMFGCPSTDRMNSVALRHSGFSPALILNNDEYTVCSDEVTDEFEFLILDEQMQTLTVNVEGESGKFESVSKQVNHDLGIVSVQAKLSTDYDSGKVYLSVIDEDGYERLDTVTFFRTPMFETELEFNSSSGIITATPDSVSYTWLLNGDTVKGQTASRLFANANGTYTAIPRNFPCATGADIGVGTVSAQSDIEGDRLFKVYPNPAEDVVTIEFSDQGGSDRAAIYDNAGRLVSQYQLNKGANRQKLKPGLKPGLYHIALESDNGRVLSRKKLIVL